MHGNLLVPVATSLPMCAMVFINRDGKEFPSSTCMNMQITSAVTLNLSLCFDIFQSNLGLFLD